MRLSAARAVACGVVMFMTAAAGADIVVDYAINVGGDDDAASGISARATWSIDGTNLTILLENTSTSTLPGRGVADELITSLGFDLGDVLIVSGDSAVIGPDSMGLGRWSSLQPGDSVAEEWLWSNLRDHDDDDDDDDGDFDFELGQVISTTMGIGNGERIDFNGDRAHVNGPFGGIAPMRPEHPYHGNQRAVSNSIMFSLTLSDELSAGDLGMIANNSLVGYGSGSFFFAVPGPGSLGLLAVALFVRAPRRARQ